MRYRPEQDKRQSMSYVEEVAHTPLQRQDLVIETHARTVEYPREMDVLVRDVSQDNAVKSVSIVHCQCIGAQVALSVNTWNSSCTFFLYLILAVFQNGELTRFKT